MTDSRKPYFLSFIGEAVLNPLFSGFSGGRVEVSDDDHEYAIEEIRWFTRKPDFAAFRERYDFKNVSGRTLERVRATVNKKYRDSIER